MSPSYTRRQALRTLALGTGAVAAGALAVPLLSSAAQAYSWTRTMQQGQTGADIKELQIRVAGWAADSASHSYVSVDGDFGPGTLAAVKRFQSAYGLSVDGVAGPNTQAKLNALQSSDNSTLHFDWSEFTSKDGSGFGGGKVGASTVQENVRRLMYKLEALRVKIGNVAITVNSGFRSIAHNAAVGGASNSMHLYGVAADLDSSVGTLTLYRKAETSGFSGLETHNTDHQHVDSRVEYAYGSQSWWWQDGTL